MNGTQSGLVTAMIFTALIIFGCYFDRYVAGLKEDADGFTWLLVVFGSFITIGG